MSMSILLIFDALTATMDLVGRLVEAQGLEGEDLERYITLRNELRKELVAQAKRENVNPDVLPHPAAYPSSTYNETDSTQNSD